jgi:hypothetical protein
VGQVRSCHLYGVFDLACQVLEAQILLLGGVLVVVWRWFWQKVGVGMGESGVGFGKCWDGFRS